MSMCLFSQLVDYCTYCGLNQGLLSQKFPTSLQYKQIMSHITNICEIPPSVCVVQLITFTVSLLDDAYSVGVLQVGLCLLDSDWSIGSGSCLSCLTDSQQQPPQWRRSTTIPFIAVLLYTPYCRTIENISQFCVINMTYMYSRLYVQCSCH